MITLEHTLVILLLLLVGLLNAKPKIPMLAQVGASKIIEPSISLLGFLGFPINW